MTSLILDPECELRILKKKLNQVLPEEFPTVDFSSRLSRDNAPKETDILNNIRSGKILDKIANGKRKENIIAKPLSESESNITRGEHLIKGIKQIMKQLPDHFDDADLFIAYAVIFAIFVVLFPSVIYFAHYAVDLY